MMMRKMSKVPLVCLLIALAGCSASNFTMPQEDGALNPEQQNNIEQQQAGEEPEGRVSEDPGGEVDPPPESPDEGYFTTGDVYDTVYIPCVEDVEIPETIFAGQPFNVTVTLSTAMRPELLNGISREYALPFEQYSGEHSIGLAIYFGENPSDYEPVYEHTVEFYHVFVRLEKDTLRIQTADSPEWGGLGVVMNITQGTFHKHDHMIWREYPITVLPAEEEKD
jgi:hypothetical protein